MSKDGPIKFRERQEDLVGRRNGMQFWIRKEPGLPDSCVPAYWVTIDPGRDRRMISTIGREYFHLDEAMEFCRRIAAGEIDLEELRAAYEAQDTEERYDHSYERYVQDHPGLFERAGGLPRWAARVPKGVPGRRRVSGSARPLC